MEALPIRSLSQLPGSARGAVIAIGNFDGVHRGHRALISELVRVAAQHGAPSMIFTFDPPPLRLLRPEPWPHPLTWMERRVEMLTQLGVDHVIAYPTTTALLELDAPSFFQRILVNELGVRGIVEGPNFRFGKDRGGDVELLKHLCDEKGIEISIVEPQRIAGEWISSSSIREAIEAGRIEQANQSLGEPYRIRGVVESGAGRGRTIGFPTANLGNIPVLIPAHGVYAGRVVRANRRDDHPLPHSLFEAPAAIHIGPNPTFGENRNKVEVHLIGLSADLYGASLEVEIVRRIRSVRKFSGKDELLAQIQADLGAVTRALSE
jgi:riboflavin kinase/FMN adenylyltransferase